jgi:hypothetical protein
MAHPYSGAAAPARAHLGGGAVVDAWVDDLETTNGLRARFDAASSPLGVP